MTASLALTAGGHGWLFGTHSPLQVTMDGGATWAANPTVADGTARTLGAGQPWPGGGGIALVVDMRRAANLLLRSVDGSTWTELAEFPDPPCCGG